MSLTGLPTSSRWISALARIQRTAPSEGRMMRYSASYSTSVPNTLRWKWLTTRSRSSGWMRATHASWVSFSDSGGRPWTARYSGERLFRKAPSRRSTSSPPIWPMRWTRASSSSRNRSLLRASSNGNSTPPDNVASRDPLPRLRTSILAQGDLVPRLTSLFLFGAHHTPTRRIKRLSRAGRNDPIEPRLTLHGTHRDPQRR